MVERYLARECSKLAKRSQFLHTGLFFYKLNADGYLFLHEDQYDFRTGTIHVLQLWVKGTRLCVNKIKINSYLATDGLKPLKSSRFGFLK